uniref:Tetratricopeptide repeat protein n=1 Tax=candidate division WOR-3 bacterium TaxID=2052148 RepID=A0A7C4GFB5_UNCW3
MLRRALAAWPWLPALAVVALLATFNISSYDTWWHLKTGEFILRNHVIPLHDMFSFSAAGNRWITHEWLFEVLMFLAWRAAAVPGVILFNVALVVAAFVFTTLSLHRLRVSPLLGVPLIALAGFLVTFRAFARPHVLSEAMLALYLLTLLWFRESAAAARRPWLLLLLLPAHIVWANSHSGFVLGIALVGLFLVGELTTSALHRRRPTAQSIKPRRLRVLGLTLAGITAASFANPNGFRALLYPLEIVRTRTFSSAIMELQTPLLPVFRNSDFFIALVCLVVVGVSSFFLARRFSPVRLLLFAVFGVLGLVALRNLPAFALVAVPLVGANLQERLPTRLPRRLLLLPTALCVGLAALVLFSGVRLPGGRRRPGLGVETGLYPIQSSGFITRNLRRGQVFNTMEFGGWLIWDWYPGRKVFIDGRLDVYGRELFDRYAAALWSGAAFRDLVEEHDITCCLLSRPQELTERTVHYLGRTLALSPDWKLVWFDDIALVYFRRDVAASLPGYSAILPILLGIPADSTGPQAVADEARRASGSAVAHIIAGNALLELRSPLEARAEFNRALELSPRHTGALQGLAMSAAAAGDLTEAIAALRRLVRLEPRSPRLFYILGSMLAQTGELAAAEVALLRAVRLAPDLAAAHSLLGQINFDRGRLGPARRHWEKALLLVPSDTTTRRRLAELPGR